MKKDTIKIKRKSMRDEVYSILQDWIVNGELEPGKKLKDSELSEMLGISRTPIREALLKLEDEGLIETKVNRWTMVSEIDVNQIEQIYPIVQALETLAIEQGFNNVTQETIKKLEGINERFKSELLSGEKESAYQLDLDFHNSIISLSNNIELSKILNNLKIKIKRIEIYYFDKKADEFQSYHEHEEIIQNLKDNNKNKIIQSIHENWQNSLNRIKNKVNQ